MMGDSPLSEENSTLESDAHAERIRVVLRLRPVPAPPPDDPTEIFGCAGTLSWVERRIDMDDMSCNLDEVYAEDESTEQVFRNALQPLVDGLVSGYNGTLFSWGAPGTGKTTTVFGEAHIDPDSKQSFIDGCRGGMARLAAERLFLVLSRLNSETHGLRASVRVSALEIGGLEVVDLLTKSDSGDLLHSDRDSLRRPCLFNGGATAVVVASVDDILESLAVARRRYDERRLSLPEGLNRRHCIFSMEVQLRTDLTDGISAPTTLSGRLSLVDLAGALEGCEQTLAASASTLADLVRTVEVLSARRSDAAVPSTGSPLTQLMQDSLGGSCRTVMLLTAVGSAEALKAEIFVPKSALQLAMKAGEVVNHPMPNIQAHASYAALSRFRQDVPKLEVATGSVAESSRSPRSSRVQKETVAAPEQCRSPEIRALYVEAGSPVTGRSACSGDPCEPKEARPDVTEVEEKAAPSEEKPRGRNLQSSLLPLAADDSVFDMSLDSEGFLDNALASTAQHGISIPLAETMVSPPARVSCENPWGQALSPIAQAPSPRAPSATLPSAPPASWPAVTSVQTVKPPPLPRPDSSPIDSSIVREALQRKFSEMSISSMISNVTVPLSGNYGRRGSLEDVSPMNSEASLSPTTGGRSIAVAEAALPASTCLSKPLSASSQPSTPAAPSASSEAEKLSTVQQLVERLATTQTLLDKRTLQLTKAQLRLQEASKNAARWQAESERLNAHTEEQAGVISALERLLGLLLSRQGPELLEDLGNLDQASLLALRSFAAPQSAERENRERSETKDSTATRLPTSYGCPVFASAAQVTQSSDPVHNLERQPTFQPSPEDWKSAERPVPEPLDGGAGPCRASPSRDAAPPNATASRTPSPTGFSPRMVLSPPAKPMQQSTLTPERQQAQSPVDAAPQSCTSPGPSRNTAMVSGGIKVVQQAGSVPQISRKQYGTPRSSQCSTTASGAPAAMTPPRSVTPPQIRPLASSSSQPTIGFRHQQPMRWSGQPASNVGSKMQVQECRMVSSSRLVGSAQIPDRTTAIRHGSSARSLTPTGQPTRRPTTVINTPPQDRFASHSGPWGAPPALSYALQSYSEMQGGSRPSSPVRSQPRTWVTPPPLSRCLLQAPQPCTGTSTPPTSMAAKPGLGVRIPDRMVRSQATQLPMAASPAPAAAESISSGWPVAGPSRSYSQSRIPRRSCEEHIAR